MQKFNTLMLRHSPDYMRIVYAHTHILEVLPGGMVDSLLFYDNPRDNYGTRPVAMMCHQMLVLYHILV